MSGYRHSGLVGGVVLSVSLLAVGACTREPASETRQENAAAAADERQDHASDVASLNDRVAELEKKYAEAHQEVASGSRTATAGLREEVREDVANVKEAVNELGTTTPQNWWERQERAMRQTADDIQADVRRLAGNKAAAAPARPAATTGTDTSTGGSFESQRDAFVASMHARVDAMKDALDDVKASGARETELDDTRARVDKLEDDIDKVASADADDWWDVSKARVTEYVDRVENSIERLDDNEATR